MLFDNRSTLFLVQSPFQCLCMLEAIERFSISKYDVVVVFSDNLSIEKIERLLVSKSIIYSKLHYCHLIKDSIRILLRSHLYYHNVFIGDYYGSTRQVAALYASFDSHIFLLDDGTQAIEICSNNHYYCKGMKLSVLILIVLIDFLLFIKSFFRKWSFFTIYPVTSNRFQIIPNNFQTLKIDINYRPQGVYIIGTNSSEISFSNYSYADYLLALYKYIRTEFPDDDIFYCPHRRDKNLLSISQMCRCLGIHLFNTQISVEYDFIEKEICPKFVVGFNSNALFTLKMFFTSSRIATITCELESEIMNMAAEEVRIVMSQYDIQTINITEWLKTSI